MKKPLIMIVLRERFEVRPNNFKNPAQKGKSPVT